MTRGERNGVVCPRCGSERFRILCDEKGNIDDLNNLIGQYYYIEILCVKCDHSHTICLGSD